MSEAILTRLPRCPLAEQVADKIVEGIAAGAIRPGEKIIESDIAQRLDVSRIPIREAMKILEAQGIVASSPHRSVRVVGFDKDKIDQIAEVRAAMEKISFREAQKTYAAEPGLLGELDRIIADMELCARENDLDGINKADLAFHRAVCAASRNGIVSTLWETLARHMRISFKLEILEDTTAAQDIPGHHRALRDALAGGNPNEVEQEVEDHIMRLHRWQHGMEPGLASGRVASGEGD